MKDKILQLENDLQQIVNLLIINGTLTECPGLIHGKMGIAIFFSHYAQVNNNQIFANYTMDLINEILKQIHANSPTNYERGIIGISIGIEYLINNGFLKVKEDICNDFVQLIEQDTTQTLHTDFSQYNGIIGYGKYWLTRLRYRSTYKKAQKYLLYILDIIEHKLNHIPITEQIDVFCFLADLQKYLCLEQASKLFNYCQCNWNLSSIFNQNINRLEGALVSQYIYTYQYYRYWKKEILPKIEAKHIPNLNTEKHLSDIGLLNGYSGEGLLRLTALGKINALWTSLL